MIGSLDEPPIIIRTSREVSLRGLFFCFIIALVSIVSLATIDAPARDNRYLFLAGAVVGGLFFSWQALRPSTLTLTPDGLTWGNSLRSRHWAWTEISNFRPSSVGGIGCDVADSRATTKLLSFVNMRLVGRNGAIGFGWEGGSVFVAELLETARARWLVSN